MGHGGWGGSLDYRVGTAGFIFHTKAFELSDIWWLLAFLVLIDYQRFYICWWIRAVHLEIKLEWPANLKMPGCFAGSGCPLKKAFCCSFHSKSCDFLAGLTTT